MRKLVYVGYNRKEDEAIETTSYEKMMEYKNKGFVFRERLDDIKEEKPMNERIKRIMEMKKKKIADALNWQGRLFKSGLIFLKIFDIIIV